MAERTYVLVVRVWQEPEGRFVVRLRGQVDPDGEPAFERVVGTNTGPAAFTEGWTS